ncbi:MAG: hypothetical protein HQ451_03765 [Candidatus Planktophila sp.]|nr:hypothetical protein [Candidatus Planktophila sp.]
MKKLVLGILLVSFLMPVAAFAAQTKFVGGPLTNLESQGATINITLSNVPTKGGLYIQQCVEAAVGTRSAVCNKAVELWISTAQGASFLPSDLIKFKPTGSYVVAATTVDCTVSKCGVFMRFDHTVPGDLTEDQFFPLTFKAAPTGSAALAADEITATINGISVSTRAPATLAYRQVGALVATSKASAALTYRSLAPTCSLKGSEVTALTGSGECAIAVTSAGNATSATVTLILPIRLTLGVQTVGNTVVAPTTKAFTKIPLALVSNFGEKIKYKAVGSCSVIKALLTVRRGTCEITATAPGRKSTFEPLNFVFTVKGI